MAAPVIFGSGNVPQKADTRWTLLVKICNATIAGGGSAKLTSGNGSPVGVVDPAAYILYVQKDSTPPGINWWSDGANWH